MARSDLRLARVQSVDERLVAAACRLVRGRRTVAALRLATRAGDWPLSLGTGVLLLTVASVGVALRFALATALALVVQRTLKSAVSRVRPCLVEGGPLQRAPIPDAGSFPSGHTLHAVLAAGTAVSTLPILALLLVPLAAVIGASRVILGVHYPSDVVAGAVLGIALAALVVL